MILKYLAGAKRQSTKSRACSEDALFGIFAVIAYCEVRYLGHSDYLIATTLALLMVAYTLALYIPKYDYEARKISLRKGARKHIIVSSSIGAAACSLMIAYGCPLLGMPPVESGKYSSWFHPLAIFGDAIADTLSIGLLEVFNISPIEIKTESFWDRALNFSVKLFVALGIIDYLRVAWSFAGGYYEFTGTVRQTSYRARSSLCLRYQGVEARTVAVLTDPSPGQAFRVGSKDLSRLTESDEIPKRGKGWWTPVHTPSSFFSKLIHLFDYTLSSSGSALICCIPTSIFGMLLFGSGKLGSMHTWPLVWTIVSFLPAVGVLKYMGVGWFSMLQAARASIKWVLPAVIISIYFLLSSWLYMRAIVDPGYLAQEGRLSPAYWLLASLKLSLLVAPLQFLFRISVLGREESLEKLFEATSNEEVAQIVR